MIIILEGPDGAGKSTLAQRLADDLSTEFSKITLHHHGPYPGVKNPCVRYLASMRRRQHQGNSELVIMDRSWLSEPIYGRALRNGWDRVGPASRRMLERVAYKCGVLLVVCLPPYEVVEENWAKRKGAELIQAPEYLKSVYRDYQMKLYQETDLVPLHYDFDEDGNSSTYGRILDRVRQVTEQRPPATGIGVWGPESTLLVGEKVSKHGIPDLPFVSFHDGGCSAWLARNLEEWQVPEFSLYWINSDGLSPDFLGREDAPTKVVALGNKAAKWCRNAGVEHRAVEHPAYWKRFHYTHEYTSLKEALK